MPDWNAITQFMSAVVPWPVDLTKDPGYVNLHYSSVDRKDPTKLHKGGGWPFRSVDTFIGRASWLTTTTQFKDAWFCLSLQSATKPNKYDPNKPRAHRLAANALAVKSIWIDMDIGAGTAYADIPAGLAAMNAFYTKHALPPYSAVVKSGGGLHFYWISKTALSVRDWAPFADGLKALLVSDNLVKDPGVTTDVARILRVPGTFNHKTTPPLAVELLMPVRTMYDFPADLAMLPALAPVISTTGKVSSSAKAPAEIFFDEGAKAAFANAVNLGPAPDKGLGTTERPPLSREEIFRQCGFYRNALATGGADYGQELWMLSILGTTWMEHGNATAHAISKGHSGYTEDDTEAMFNRKVAERASADLGYPSCAKIAGAGCKDCATCPLFAKGKSPLNIEPVITAAVNPLNMAAPHLNQSATAGALHLPDGYDVDTKGRICKIVQPIINGEPAPIEMLPLFMSIISLPWLQADPDAICFTATRSKGNVTKAVIAHEDIVAMGLDRVFAKQHVKIFPENKKYLEQFTMSWLAKLQELSAGQQAMPFGWHKDAAGAIDGFAYGGTLMLEDGSEVAATVGDPQLRKVFHPAGTLDPWFDAVKVITGQKRQELDAIIALSFSSPLTPLIGMNSITMCAYGETGVGKSASYALGISVWGDPKKGKQVSHSTFNSVMKTMGELNNLPMYWDEIKDEKAQASVHDFVYNSSDGVEKGRQKSDLTLQNRGTWANQMCMAANISFTDYVMRKAPTHAAGVSRVLEYYVGRSTSPVGRMHSTDASVLIDKLNTNHGNVGLLYAKLLGMNHAAIKQMCIDSCKQVSVDMKEQEPERMWVALVGTMIVGANLANKIAAEQGKEAIFDEPALKAFLYKTYQDNRDKRDGMMNTAGRRETTESLMAGFFGKQETADTVLWTKGMPETKGRPFTCEVVHGPQNTKNTQQDTNVTVRWDVRSRRLYIDKAALSDYFQNTTGAYGTHFASLTKEYGMVTERRIGLGAGTIYIIGRRPCCVFSNIDPNHDWFDVMMKWSNAADKEAAYTMPTEPTVETGFADAGLSADDVLKMAKGV